MFGYDNLSIDFLTDSPVLVWLTLFVLVGVAVFSYFKTNPPLPRFLRVVLGFLRLVAILAIVLALLEPVVSFSRQYQRPKRVTVLIDRSDSMEKIEEGKTRRARVDSLISSVSFGKLENESVVSKLFFAGNLRADVDKVEADKTAIGEALYEIERVELVEPADYRFLLSDGNSNYGRQPGDAASRLSSPLYTIDMSAGGAEFDVAISNIDFNPLLYVGQSTELKVRLVWQGKLSESVTVRLLDGQRLLVEQSFSAEQESGMAEISIKYIPEEPGRKLLRISLPQLSGEITADNNTRSFAVKVLKSKMSVLLVSLRPDYEVGFIKRYFEKLDRFEVTLLATGPKAGNIAKPFPLKQAELNRHDLVVLHDPDPLQLQPARELLNSYLKDRGGSIWLLMGEQFATRGPLKWFNELLPFYQSERSAIDYRQFHCEPVEGNLLHPANRIAESQSEIRRAWSELPPYESLVRCNGVDPNGVVLAEASDPFQPERRWPVTGFKRHGPGKVFACAALPFWSWSFAGYGFGEEEQYYGKFIEGASSWLTVKEDLEPVRVLPVKRVFSRGEVVRFEGFAYDLGFRPLPGVVGSVTLESPGEQSSDGADLLPEGEGKYVTEFYNLSAGKHHWTGRFEKDGRTIKEDGGEIMVESFTLEEFDQRGNVETLTSIAHQSGGKYYKFAQFDDAIAAISTEPVEVSETGDFVLWGKLWLLIIFISALSLEWFLRKMFQLI